MDQDLDTRIRQRAYDLWDKDGQPPDKTLEYWLAAEQQIKGEDLDEGLADSFPASDPPASTMRGG